MRHGGGTYFTPAASLQEAHAAEATSHTTQAKGVSTKAALGARDDRTGSGVKIAKTPRMCNAAVGICIRPRNKHFGKFFIKS